MPAYTYRDKNHLKFIDGISNKIDRSPDTAAATSATNAATSATNAAASSVTAASSATTATTQASNAATSATNAATSATNAATSYDNFDDRFLGAKSSDPSVDNDGGSLLTGAMYFNSSNNVMMVYTGSAWVRTTPTSSDQTNINTLAAADVVADMAILATADIVTDMAILGTADVVTDMNTLGTADVVADMNVLGTADVVSDMNILATADIVTDMNVLGTSANVTAMGHLGTAANVTAMATCATNIADVNNFVDQYTISSSAPGSPSEGDLWYDSSANVLKVHNGTSFVAVTSATAGITDIVDDTTPQLGGNLDLQTYTLSNVSLANGGFYSNPNTITGDATVTTATTKNMFLFGEIAVNDTYTWTIAGNGILQIK